MPEVRSGDPSPGSAGQQDSDVLAPLETVTSAVSRYRHSDSPKCHSRSSSHDSYFERKNPIQFKVDLEDFPSQGDKDFSKCDSSLDISEIQVDFELEDNEMKIFSEDEAMLSTSVGSDISCSRSPLDDITPANPHKLQDNTALPIVTESNYSTRSEFEQEPKSRRMSFKQKFKKFKSPTISRKQSESVVKAGSPGASSANDNCKANKPLEETKKGSKLKERIVSALSPDSMRKRSESHESSPRSSKSAAGSPVATAGIGIQMKHTPMEDEMCSMTQLNISPSIRFIDASSYELSSSHNREKIITTKPGPVLDEILINNEESEKNAIQVKEPLMPIENMENLQTLESLIVKKGSIGQIFQDELQKEVSLIVNGSEAKDDEPSDLPPLDFAKSTMETDENLEDENELSQNPINFTNSVSNNVTLLTNNIEFEDKNFVRSEITPTDSKIVQDELSGRFIPSSTNVKDDIKSLSNSEIIIDMPSSNFTRTEMEKSSGVEEAVIDKSRELEDTDSIKSESPESKAEEDEYSLSSRCDSVDDIDTDLEVESSYSAERRSPATADTPATPEPVLECEDGEEMSGIVTDMSIVSADVRGNKLHGILGLCEAQTSPGKPPSPAPDSETREEEQIEYNSTQDTNLQNNPISSVEDCTDIQTPKHLPNEPANAAKLHLRLKLASKSSPAELQEEREEEKDFPGVEAVVMRGSPGSSPARNRSVRSDFLSHLVENYSQPDSQLEENQQLQSESVSPPGSKQENTNKDIGRPPLPKTFPPKMHSGIAKALSPQPYNTPQPFNVQTSRKKYARISPEKFQRTVEKGNPEEPAVFNSHAELRLSDQSNEKSVRPPSPEEPESSCQFELEAVSESELGEVQACLSLSPELRDCRSLSIGDSDIEEGDGDGRKSTQSVKLEVVLFSLSNIIQ